MRFNPWITYLSASLMFASTPLSAKPMIDREQVQIPQCLAAKLPSNYVTLAENKEFKIIDIPSIDLENLVHLADEVACGRFINMSHHMTKSQGVARNRVANQLLKKMPKKASLASYAIEHQSDVIEAINHVKTTNIMETLTHLTNYENRSAKKQTGVEAAQWLKASFEAMASEYQREDTSTYMVKTGSRYKQPSVVTVIGKDIKAPAIVIGAHMDTLDGRMPGAGDDGSGSASIMEMARVLLESPLRFKRPVYFIWYAAEERGLVGSQYVVQDFIQKSIPVKAAIQFDMTGFRNDKTDSTMWVYKDYTDNQLSNFVAKLIETYLGVPVGESSCGYGCSDHASWDAEGIPAAFPCETAFDQVNSKIHTSGDTIARLTPEHMTNFSKLGVAFAIELASS